MAGTPRKFLKYFPERINKLLVHNPSISFDTVSERAQNNLSNLRMVTSSKYEDTLKQIKNYMDEQNNVQKQLPLGIKYAVDWWQWYRKLTGLDVVDIAKQQVMSVQNELFDCQNKRRKLSEESILINEKIKEIYNEMVQTKRDDPKFVQLTIHENKGLQEQSKIHRMLACLENEERDHFTRLATAIKEYHDSQAVNAMKYKYLSILVSTLLALISLTGSMIYNNRRIADIRNAVVTTQLSIEENLSQQVSIILNKIDELRQTKATKVVAAVESISDNNSTAVNDPVNTDTASIVETINQKLFIDTHDLATDFRSEIEKIKQASYYLGIGILSVYALQLIFRS